MSALWSAGDLRAATGGLPRAPFAATGVSIDSRTTKPGDLFVALRGDNGDGHDHVAAALARGAAGAMVHRLPDGVADDAALLQVPDTFAGLHALGRFARARFKGRVVAVTGSVGKTTTKEMLRVALSAFGRAWAAEASHNNHWGVPLTLARTPARHDFCVVEIGMNHAGEIAPLSRLARPHAALVTAIAPAHIGNLGSLEAIRAEKYAVTAGLEPGGVVVLPEGFGEPADATFGETQLLRSDSDAAGNSVVAEIGGRRVAFRMAAPGRHMAMNAVAALTLVAQLGLDPAMAAAALDGFAPVAGRGARRELNLPHGTATLLDESYNASSAAMRAALSVLALQPAARRVAVLGDMLELGEAAAAEHRGLAPDVLASADLLFTCGPQMRLLHEAVPGKLRGAHADDAVALAPLVAAALRHGDAVLVKGSLGSRMRLVVQTLEGTH